MTIRPELLSDVDDERQLERLLVDDNVCAQLKLDGYRLMVERSQAGLAALNKKGQPKEVPVWLRDALGGIDGLFHFDGEGLSLDKQYGVFDQLSNGSWIGDKPYAYRLLKACEYVAACDSPHVVVAKTATGEQAKREFLAWAEKDNQEGVVFKPLDAPYREGRAHQNLRWKFRQSISVIVGPKLSGAKESKLTPGQPPRGVGAYLLDANGNPRYVAPVGIAAKHALPKDGDVIKVVTWGLNPGKDGMLCGASFKMVRDDVSPDECVIAQVRVRNKKKAGEE